jgi:hypothetical protein
MTIKSLQSTSLTNNVFYRSVLAGNDAYFPEFESDDFLEEVVLSSSASSVTFSGLGAYSDYKHLQIRAIMRSAGTGYQTSLNMRANGDTASNYWTHKLAGNGSAVSSGAINTTRFYLDPGLLEGSTASGNFSPMILDILDFSNPNKTTTIRGTQGVYGSARTSDRWVSLFSGLWNNTAPLTSFEIYVASFEAGTRFSLYGSKG